MIRLSPLSDQVVVVMGASSGIGRAAALRLADRCGSWFPPATPAPWSRWSKRSTKREAKRRRCLRMSPTPPPSKAVAEAAVDTHGGIDTWVHAAAVLLVSRVEDTTADEFRRVIDVNLMGQVHAVMAALPHLPARGQGSFVSVSSVEARRAMPYHGAYAAAKHGVEGLLEALRVELRQEGVPHRRHQRLARVDQHPTVPKGPHQARRAFEADAAHLRPRRGRRRHRSRRRAPSRDLLAGGAAKALLLGQRLSPSLLDAVLVRIGFRAQRTAEPADGADNLFAPLPHLAAPTAFR